MLTDWCPRAVRSAAVRVTELPYYSLMEFGGGPTRYAMRCPAQASAAAAAVGGSNGGGLPPSPTAGPVNIRKCTEGPAGPGDAQMLWRQAAVAGTNAVQFQLVAPSSDAGLPRDGSTGDALCLTAVHDSGVAYNDELDALPCNSSDDAQRWIWMPDKKLKTAMSQAEKDKVWSGRPGRCNGAVACCIDVNAHNAADGQVLQGEDCADATAWAARPMSAGTVMIASGSEPGFCIA